MSIVLVGSTSGSVTLQEPAVAGTTVLTLPAVTGTVLTDTSPKAGNVLQVVNAVNTSYVTTTGTTYIDTGLTATITPTSSSSKILVIVDHQDCQAASSGYIGMKLLRNGSQIALMASQSAYTSSSITADIGSISINYLDSPATTSAVTYKTQFNNQNGPSGITYMNAGAVGTASTITLMEIAA